MIEKEKLKITIKNRNHENSISMDTINDFFLETTNMYYYFFAVVGKF